MKSLKLFLLVIILSMVACKKEVSHKIIKIDYVCNSGYKTVGWVKMPLTDAELKQIIEDMKKGNYGAPSMYWVCTEFKSDTTYY